MQHVDTAGAQGFEIVGGSRRSQAATMTLAAGESTGGSENRHSESDQWLYVVSGTGRAIVEGEAVELTAGSLILIEAGEGHEIASGEAEPLVTVSVYAPPAY